MKDISKVDYTINKRYPLSLEQNDLVEFLLKNKFAVNSAQTGYGKTYTTLNASLIYAMKNKEAHVVILCPQCAVKSFRRELEEKLVVKYNVFSSSKPIVSEGARFHIVTQSSIKKNIGVIDRLHELDKKLILLVDEAQILQDCNNQFYKLISEKKSYFSIIWLMTATPLGNNLYGLYHLMNFVDPSKLGTFEQFKINYVNVKIKTISRWCGKYPNKYRKSFNEEIVLGYKNLDKLGEVLKESIIVKQKQYKLEWHYHKVDLNKEEQLKYINAGQGLERETSETNFAVRLHDLQMLVDNLSIPMDKIVLEHKLKEKLADSKGKVNEKKLKEAMKSVLDKFNENRHTEIMTSDLSSKEKKYIEVVASEMKKGHPILTYLDYSDSVERLELLLEKTKKLTGVKQILKVTGSVTLKQREKVEEAIKEGTVVLITSAGTESINLQKSNSMIFYNTPFSVLTFIQAVGRITRMDSKFDKQHIHFIEANGTIDTYKRILINMNADLIEALFGRYRNITC